MPIIQRNDKVNYCAYFNNIETRYQVPKFKRVYAYIPLNIRRSQKYLMWVMVSTSHFRVLCMHLLSPRNLHVQLQGITESRLIPTCERLYASLCNNYNYPGNNYCIYDHTALNYPDFSRRFSSTSELTGGDSSLVGDVADIIVSCLFTFFSWPF